MAAVAAMCVACQNDASENSNNDEMVEVTLGFGGFSMEQESMTRSLSPVTDVCTHLDIWVYESGSEVSAFHQATGDDGFGSLTLTLNLTKSYTIYAVAHRGNGAATLSDGVISFADEKITHTFFYTTTFTPTKNMSLNCEMQRIVAMFQFNTTDAMPDWCKAIRFTATNVFDRWNVSTGGTHQLDRVSTVNITSTHNDGTITCNVYQIVTDVSTNHDILVEALDEGGDVVESHQFQNVPLRNNYKTVATGAFFTDAASSFTFKADDWAASDLEYAF